MFSMNLSAPVVAKAEADAGAYTVGQAAHDPGLIELLRHRLVELAWFPDDDVVNRFNVGGTKECADRVHGPLARIAAFSTFQRLRSCGARWPPATFVCARSLWCGPQCPTSALCRTFSCRSRPPLPTYYAPGPPTVPSPPPCPIISHATHSNFVSC